MTLSRSSRPKWFLRHGKCHGQTRIDAQHALRVAQAPRDIRVIEYCAECDAWGPRPEFTLEKEVPLIEGEA